MSDDIERNDQCKPMLKQECKSGFKCTKCRWFLLFSFIFFLAMTAFSVVFMLQNLGGPASTEIDFGLPDYEEDEVLITSYHETVIKVNSTQIEEMVKTKVVTKEEVEEFENAQKVIKHAQDLADHLNNTNIEERNDDLVEEFENAQKVIKHAQDLADHLNNTNIEERNDDLVDEYIEFDLQPHLMPDLSHPVLAQSFPVPVEELYATLMSDDSVFYKQWMESNLAYDIEFSPWAAGKKKFKGHTVRNLVHKVKTDNMFISQGFIAVETRQILYGSSEESSRYVVDNFNQMDGMPFSDQFYSVARHSFRAMSPNESELRISCAIRYHGNPWQFMRDMLEKNIYVEFDRDYEELGDILSEHLQKL